MNACLVDKTDELLDLIQMYQFFHRLLGTAPTSTFNPSWKGVNRSAGEQVVSGLRLGGGLVGGILVIVLAFAGVSNLPLGTSTYGRFGLFASWSMFCVASVIMLITAHRWASWPAAASGFVGIRTISLLLFGRNGAIRTEAIEILIFCIVVIALNWRFFGDPPAPTIFLDRIALAFFVLSTLKQMSVGYHWPPIPLISGLSALFIAWCVSIATSGKKAETSARELEDSRNAF